MKFSKILLALLLILALGVTFVACGGQGGDDPVIEPEGPGDPENPNGGTPGGGTSGGGTPGGGTTEVEPTGNFVIKFRFLGTGKCAVSGFEGKGEGAITIPTTYKIDGADCTVVSIDAGAFRNCKYITSITVPDTVETIGVGAFEGCQAIEALTLPFVGGAANANTYIGHLFGAKSFAANASYVPATLKTVSLSDLCTVIAPFAFDSCPSIETVKLGNATTTIGEYAFANCSITQIDLPATVTKVGAGAYAKCPIVSATVPFVGEDATGAVGYLGHLFGASSYEENPETVPATLKQLEIMAGCTVIGDGAFYECATLETIKTPLSVLNIGKDAFVNTPEYNARRDGDVYIGKVYYTYKGEMDSTDVTIIPGTIAIAAGAFDGRALTSITIPDSVQNIGAAAFRGSVLAEITLPFVGENATTTTNTYLGYIFGATSADENGACVPAALKTVTLADHVTTVAPRAFYGCDNITCVNLGSGVTTLAKDAFFACPALSTIAVSAGNTSFKNDHDLVYNAAGNELFAVPMAKQGEVRLLNITEILEGQFRDCTGITKITLPETLRTIGNDCFAGATALQTIEFSQSLSSVGTGAFADTAWYTAQADGIVRAGNVIYKVKGNLADGNVVIPAGVTGIAADAFAGSGATAVNIPASVTDIGLGAFRDCQITSMVLPFVGGNRTDATKAHLGYVFGATTSGLSRNFVPATLTSVELLDVCTNLGEGAFNGCTNLATIEIGASVTWVQNEAMHDTAWFKNQPVGVVYVGRVAYSFIAPAEDAADKSVYDVVLRPDTVSVAPHAFEQQAITSIRMPDATVSIGAYAFEKCAALSSVRISSYIEEIGEFAFSRCESLVSFKIPATLKVIKEGTFRGCSNLKTVDIAKGLQSIEKQAFVECIVLSNVNAGSAINYYGTQSDLNEIEIADDALGGATIKRSPSIFKNDPYEV